MDKKYYRHEKTGYVVRPYYYDGSSPGIFTPIRDNENYYYEGVGIYDNVEEKLTICNIDMKLPKLIVEETKDWKLIGEIKINE